MAANLAQSPKVVAISRGPLDEPGFTLTPTGLIIDKSVTYERWELYGRKLAIAERGIQWALGDWIRHGEKAYGEKYTQAIELTGLKTQTLMNYAFVAKAFAETYRRREIVDFSTHAEVASLPVPEQERILSKAAKEDTSRRDVRKEARRVKKRLKVIPDELDLLHTPEVQTFLEGYVEVLKGLDDHIPSSVMFLHGMIQAHVGQAQWQKDRTVDADCEAIIESFEDVYSQTDEDVYRWLIRSGYFMSDPDLDDRLEFLVQTKKLKREKQGGRKDTQRGDMVDIYMLYDQATGDAANVPHNQSIYEMGERE